MAQRAFCIYINVLWDMGHSVHEKSIGNITFAKRGIKPGYIQVNTIKPFFNIDIIFTVSLKVFLVVLVVCGCGFFFFFFFFCLFVCFVCLLLLCVCFCMCVCVCARVRACVHVCVLGCVRVCVYSCHTSVS